MTRKIANGAVMIALVLAMVAVRVVWSSRGEWRLAEAATGEEQLVHLGRAARLYAPGNPYSRRALDALATIGRDDPVRALAAWRAVRSSILATRSCYTPRRALLREANGHIAELMAREELRTTVENSNAQLSIDAARAWHAARLAADDAPSVAWTLVALAGLLGFIGCAVGFCLRAIDAQDRLRRRRAIAWALGVVGGLALFFIGLSRA